MQQASTHEGLPWTCAPPLVPVAQFPQNKWQPSRVPRKEGKEGMANVRRAQRPRLDWRVLDRVCDLLFAFRYPPRRAAANVPHTPRTSNPRARGERRQCSASPPRELSHAVPLDEGGDEMISSKVKGCKSKVFPGSLFFFYLTISSSSQPPLVPYSDGARVYYCYWGARGWLAGLLLVRDNETKDGPLRIAGAPLYACSHVIYAYI